MTGVSTHEFKVMAPQGKDLGQRLPSARILAQSGRRTRTCSLFGGFGLGNFGNEITLQAILCHLRRLLPNVRVSCICTHPVETAAAYKIIGVPISRTVVTAWRPQNRVARALRSGIIGMPSELCRWFEAFRTLRGTDVLIIPGTGLLTDAYGLRSWGPYNLFKWSFTAKMRGCKVLFVSVGAGPIYSRVGRWLVRSTLAMADFRSYRDRATKEYLSSIGAAVAGDRIFPDLAFSISDEIVPKYVIPRRRRSVIGLGLMLYHGRLSSDKSRESTYAAYLDRLVVFVKWLLARDYDVRLLIGELSDTAVIAQFKDLLKDRLGAYQEGRIIDDPILTVEDLLAQLAETDAIVGTRFHNVLLALVLNKPVICISFHQKCTSLMEDMGLREYCQDIKELDADKLIEQFCQLEKNADSLRLKIGQKAEEFRKALDDQYNLIFQELASR
jgi:polysaccharide pyruvyl transferase WcaK-like protein